MKKYGALLKIDGVVVNKDQDIYAVCDGLHIPDYIYWDGVPMTFENNFFVYIGNRKLFGDWLAIYNRDLWFVNQCNLRKKYTIDKDWFTRHDETEGIIKKPLGSMSDVYISTLDPDGYTNRSYMGLDCDNKHYEVIFGYGITTKTDEWKLLRKDSRYKFTDSEITEINNWLGLEE